MKNDVFLFDYSNKGLIVKRMYTVNERGSRIIMVHTDDMSDEVTDAMRRNKASEEYLDSKLKETAVKLFEHHNISTVYLTGEAFAGEFNTPSFIGYICDRRRVFAGDNLYCKGACYQAVAADYPPDRDIIVACKERITTGIEIPFDFAPLGIVIIRPTEFSIAGFLISSNPRFTIISTTSG